jgi:putative membrane protein
MSDTLKGYLFALVSALTYGMIPLFMIPLKKLDFFSVDTALFYRFLIAAILILGYLVFYQKESVKINLKEGFVLSILGLFYALSAEFLFIAYDFLSPGIASTIFFIYPIMVALILGIFFKEKITLATTISLLIVVVGVGVLSIKDNFEINYIGLFVSLLGALMYALYMIIVNKTKIKASGVKVSFYSMVFASLFFLVKTLVLGNSVVIPSLEIGTHLALFSLITTALSVVSLVYAIKYIGSTPTAIMGSVEPVVAVMISVGLFDEPLTLSLIVGVIIIISGVLIDVVFNKKK